MKTIKVLGVGDPAVDVYVDPELNILKHYEDSTGVQVDFTIVPWKDYYEQLMKAFRIGDYDIVMVAGHLWLKDFLTNNYLSPVGSIEDEQEKLSDILPIVRKEMTMDKTIYLKPSFCDGHILVYRKSSLSNNNISIPRVITIDELIDIIGQIDTDKASPFALKAHSSEIFTDFLPYLRNEGIEPFDENGKPQFNNKNGVAALKKYIALRAYCPKNTHEYGNEDIKQVIQDNTVDLTVTWSGQLGHIINDDCKDKEDLGFALIKTGWNATWCFGINQKTDKKEECIAFLDYLTSGKIDQMVGSSCGCPVRYSTLKKDKEEYPWYDYVQGMLEDIAYPLPNLNHTGGLIGAVTEQIYKAFIGEQSPETALDKAEKQVYKIIGD